MAKVPISEAVVFAHRLKQAREAAGLSQQELAEAAGLDRTYVSNLERCLGNPSLAKMASLSGALGTTVIALLTERDDAHGQSETCSSPLPREKALHDVVAALRSNGVID